MARTLESSWSTTASGRPSFEIFAAAPALILFVLEREADWGFSVRVGPIPALDQVVVRIERNGALLHLGWDNWSGFYLFADQPAGDEQVRALASSSRRCSRPRSSGGSCRSGERPTAPSASRGCSRGGPR